MTEDTLLKERLLSCQNLAPPFSSYMRSSCDQRIVGKGANFPPSSPGESHLDLHLGFLFFLGGGKGENWDTHLLGVPKSRGGSCAVWSGRGFQASSGNRCDMCSLLSFSSPLAPRVHFPGQEQLVRLIYQGQLLRDDAQTLAALHLTHNSVVHCHISQHRPPPAPTGTHANAANADAAHAALNVGSLMVPLFVLMLGALWYFQLQYRHVFTATATTCLAGLTLVFSFVAFAVYRR